jgi:hypothetical protein
LPDGQSRTFNQAIFDTLKQQQIEFLKNSERDRYLDVFYGLTGADLIDALRLDLEADVQSMEEEMPGYTLAGEALVEGNFNKFKEALIDFFMSYMTERIDGMVESYHTSTVYIYDGRVFLVSNYLDRYGDAASLNDGINRRNHMQRVGSNIIYTVADGLMVVTFVAV